MLNALVDNDSVVVTAAALVALILAVAAMLGARRGRATRSVLWTALVMWLLVIAVVTLGSTVTSQLHGARGLNLVPFQEIERGLQARGSSAWLNLVGNVALFAPLGFLAACLARARFLSRVAAAVVFGLVLSASIEVAQYVLGRVADIDDIILNTTGALAGGLVGALVAAITDGARRSGASREPRRRSRRG
ncbi:MAG: VanZ family protein [Demequina sp.]